MSELKDKGPWVNHDAAMAFVRALKHPGTEQWVMRALTAAIMRAGAGEPPDAPFDLLFLAKTMAALFEKRELLIRVLSGEDLRWWPDEE